MDLICICGGIIEISSIVGAILVFISTHFYNKVKYSKFVKYKEKHSHCGCHCHDGEKS